MPKNPGHVRQLYSRPPNARMLRIHEHLRDGHLVNCTKLAREMEVSAKTIARDLDFMRDQLGLPIEYNALIASYEYTHPVQNFPTIQITEGELLALYVARQALSQYKGTPFEKQLGIAFDKLAGSLRDKIDFATNGAPAVSFKNPGAGQADLDVFQKVSGAVLKQREIKFLYRKPQEIEPSERHVRPFHLTNSGNFWYLVSFDVRRQSMRTFALARMAAVEVLEAAFTVPVGFSPEAYFGKSLGIFVGDGDHVVRIHFERAAAELVRERFWHESQMVQELIDGGLELSMYLGDLGEVERWVLGWGTGATVLEPDELRERVRATADELARRYPPLPPVVAEAIGDGEGRRDEAGAFSMLPPFEVPGGVSSRAGEPWAGLPLF